MTPVTYAQTLSPVHPLLATEIVAARRAYRDRELATEKLAHWRDRFARAELGSAERRVARRFVERLEAKAVA
jgi:hypothetical protein